MIKNIKDLASQVDKCVEKAIKLTKDVVYDVVLNKVLDYYEEPVFDGYDEPLNYERTGKLQESLTSSVIYNKNQIGFTVGWENDYLEYRYEGWQKQYKRGKFGVNKATGEEVLRYFNSGRHGGDAFKGSHNFWDEVFEEIDRKYGGINNLFKANCKKVGLPIK